MGSLRSPPKDGVEAKILSQNNKPNGGVKMKLYRWNELSEEAKRMAVERYGNEKIDEWVLERDSWFDEHGFIVEN